MSLKPANVPDGAVPIPPSQFIVPGVQESTVANIVQVWAHEDNNQATFYANACSDWLTVNAHNRELGLPIMPKPVAVLRHVVGTFHDADTGIIWVWITSGVPVGAPCPDLPVITIPAPGNVAIGIHLFGNYWQCLPTDTATAGGTPVHATSSDGMTGLWQKEPWGPFGDHWVLLSMG